jgi:hypothetical protein
VKNFSCHNRPVLYPNLVVGVDHVAVGIVKMPSNFNREDSYPLHTAWKKLLSFFLFSNATAGGVHGITSDAKIRYCPDEGIGQLKS